MSEDRVEEFTLEETYEVCKDQPGFDGRVHVELVRLRMNAYLHYKVKTLNEWWHKEWHRATGIPCDGTKPYCPIGAELDQQQRQQKARG